MSARGLLSILLLLPGLHGCASPPAKKAVAAVPAPASAGTAPTPIEPCPRIMQALDRQAQEREAVTQLSGFEELALEERRAVIAVRGIPHWNDAIDEYERASVEYIDWLRATDDVSIFAEKMGAFLNHCTLPECAPVTMVIGAHTMHQPRLDETLPQLAIALANVKLHDPALQAELTDLRNEARLAGAAIGSQRGPKAQAALEKARARLRANCEDADGGRACDAEAGTCM